MNISKRSCVIRVHGFFTYFIVMITFFVVMQTSLFANPSISGISGKFSNSEEIIIAGSSFGTNGPNVVFFDDFEKGTVNSRIMTGSDSAQVGMIGENLNSPYYTDSTSVSGSLAFQADNSSSWMVSSMVDLPLNCRNLYISWWLFLPSGDNYPGETDSAGINWKQIWILGNDTVTDDLVIPVRLNTTWLVNGNDINPGYRKYITIGFQKGEWKRLSCWLKGGYLNDGQFHFWELDNPNGLIQRAEDNNINILKKGGAWKQVGINRYARPAANCHPTFDDIYIASGPYARARVNIGNNSVYSKCTNLTIATVTNWTNSSIKAVFRQGSFKNGDTAYVFVIDADGNVSTNAGENKVLIGGESSGGVYVTEETQLSIATSFLQNGYQNTAYNQTLSASGGTAPYSWRINSGNLPVGLSLDSSGNISGTPTTIGTATFAVTVTDSNSNTTTKSFTIQIKELPETPIDMEANWSMDEGGGYIIDDSSGQNNTLTMSGATWVQGIFGTALHFNGTSDYAYADNSSLSDGIPAYSADSTVVRTLASTSTETTVGEDFTLSAWIKLDKLNHRHPILSKQGNETRGFLFSVEDTNKLALEVFKDAGTKTGVISSASLRTDKWYHVAATYDYIGDGSSKIRLYIEGFNDGSTDSASGPVMDNTVNLELGSYRWNDGYQKFMAGTIDDVKIYNKALSQGDVSALFAAGSQDTGDNTTGGSEEEPIVRPEAPVIRIVE